MILPAVLALLALQDGASNSDIGTQMKAVGVAMDKWKVCTAKAVNTYARTTKEPAASVVEASIGECGEDYKAVGSALRAALSAADSEETLKKMMDYWRPQLMAGVFRLRSTPAKP